MNATALRTPTLRRSEDALTDRRLHRRVSWSTRVRGLTPAGQEFEAETIDVCAGGLRISFSDTLDVGDRLVLYLDEIGRVEGTVKRALRNLGYAIEFNAPPRKREKIADQLTWLINRDALNLEEDRVAERRRASGEIDASFGNGITVACTVLDMSIFGVALKTNGPRPTLGERVKVGGRTGTCVRFIDDGFAVDFRTVDTETAN